MLFYGRNVITEALNSKFKVSSLFLQEGINVDSKIAKIITLAKEKSVPVKYIPRNDLNKITKSFEHQGVASEVDFHLDKLDPTIDYSSGNSAYIFINEPTYEHNVGAIIRSAEIAGFKGVIIPKDSKISPVIGRTSAGAIFHIPIYSEAIFNCMKKFSGEGFKILGIERGGKNYFEENLKDNILFIIGGEDSGLSDAIVKKCDGLVTIPQSGKINSLNMSVASAIIIFDFVRQNRA